ncbi:methionyl-tRNA formyltransferase [Pirellulaceae bacterium SH449]
MRLVLMGTGPFAVPSFEALRADGHEICCVITRPEVITNAKKGPPPSPVRLWALANGLKHESPDSINSEEAIAFVQQFQADLLVVCDYGQILSNAALGTAKWGGINLHGSLLPRHRGAAPVQWSILSGDRQAGVTVIHMTPGLDAGPVIQQDATEIGTHENAGELEQRLSQLGVDTIRRSLLLLEQSDGKTGSLQDKSKTTKAPRLKKSDGQIRCDYPVRLLDRQLRGLQPWPGCYGEFESVTGNRIRVILHEGVPVVCNVDSLPLGGLLLQDQLTTVDLSDAQIPSVLGVVCKDGVFLLKTLQVAGKKSMTAEEFARGYSKNAPYTLVASDSGASLLDEMLTREVVS